MRALRTLEFRGRMPAPVAQLFAWHARPGALERLIPPFERVRIVRSSGGIADGGTVELLLGGWPSARWRARHEHFVENQQFCDVQERGPFAVWRHAHHFEADPADAGASWMRDEISFALPGAALGAALAGGWVERRIRRTFSWRHERTRRDLLRHARFGGARLRIALSGGSGLIGRSLRAFLTTGGHTVVALVRRAAGPGEIVWNPAADRLDAAALEGFDAVIHLGGAGIAQRRWTRARKAVIRDSRVRSTGLLARGLAGLRRPPRAFLCASALGFYGDRGDEVLREDSPVGAGFLPEVCEAWEAACAPAREAGIRVVNLRTGIVLARRGGALAAMLTPFSLGVGGVVGSGRQYMSWIGLDDLLGAIQCALGDERIAGPVNCTAPEPATNRAFTRALGSVMCRPTVIPMPAAVIRLALGELGEALLLQGARVLPQRLQEAGFVFQTPRLEDALRWELGLSAR